MRDSFRAKFQFKKSSQQRRLASTMKPSASSIFSNAVRSRIIRKLPDGQISMESPEQVASLSDSKKLCKLPRKVDSERSTALSKLRLGNCSNTLSCSEEKRVQISSYTEGAYASIAKTNLLRLIENMRQRKPFEARSPKTIDHDFLLSTPVNPSTPNQNSMIKTSMLDHLWHTPIKISQHSNQSATIEAPIQVETPAALKKRLRASKKTNDVPQNLYNKNQNAESRDISVLLQDAATAPFLNIPTDIDFNDRICYSPADVRKLQPELETESSISRLSSDSSTFASKLYHHQSLKDLDAFRWQPRSPADCWQPTLLL